MSRTASGALSAQTSLRGLTEPEEVWDLSPSSILSARCPEGKLRLSLNPFTNCLIIRKTPGRRPTFASDRDGYPVIVADINADKDCQPAVS